MHRSRLPLTTWFWAAHLMTTHSNGMSALQLQDQLGVTYKTAWLLTQKLRRSMVNPDREPLEGVVEVDQAEIDFREGDTFFEPGNAGKILVIGAVEVIERNTKQAKPRRKHAKYLDTRSGRIRLAMIADNSAASIEAFVNANVKRGATLLTDGQKSYPGLTGYRSTTCQATSFRPARPHRSPKRRPASPGGASAIAALIAAPVNPANQAAGRRYRSRSLRTWSGV